MAVCPTASHDLYNQFLRLKKSRVIAEERIIRNKANGYPHTLSSSGMNLKFMP
jgi:hypothetical protein